MMQTERKLVDQFDKDGDKRLNAAERKAAREFLQQERAKGGGNRGPGPGGPGGPGGPRFRNRNQNQEPAKPGIKLSPADVKSFPDAALYDPKVLRTLFLEFENADWEKELEDFHKTDVEVPARLTVDGKSYSDVGVHFRGMSSYMMVGAGWKRPLNLSLDFVHEDQQLKGYRTLDLLNSHEDPTFLRTVLYNQIAREYIPAPKANFVRVVINGESWGLYVNAQAFNKDSIEEWFGTTKGARWKVPGSPRAQGSLAYLGDDPASYKRLYEIKSKDQGKSWKDLIKLCRVLNQTSPDRLEGALAPLLDIDGALRFLALENVFINNDGYWIRTSDYSLYEDEKGRFHVLPHDTNETFSRPGGPGFGGRGGPGGGRFGPGFGPEANGRDRGNGGPPPDFGDRRPGDDGPGPGRGPEGVRVKGVELDPLLAANDPTKPLISKLLAVPALRARYLAYVREMAETWLDWNKLGPLAEAHHAFIASEVKADTRKLESFEDFNAGLGATSAPGDAPGGGTISLKAFAEQRRAFLLKQSEEKKAAQ